VEALNEPEMTAADDRTDCDERVMKIEVQPARGKPRTCYAIYDGHLGYWRGTSVLTEHYAWTRDTKRRAEFPNRAEAERELMAILHWRRERECASAAQTDCALIAA